jgi:transcriptional regulator with XRE-family HTH domain
MVGRVDVGAWLQVARSVPLPPDGSDAGAVIRWYRKQHDLTQHAAAALLNTTQSRLSKLETGSLQPGLDELRFVAAKLSIPPERLGILPDRSVDAVPQPDQVSGSPGAALASQRQWKAVRAELNANRAILGDLAGELYPQSQRIPGSTVLTRPEWMPGAPVEISDIELYWVADHACQRPSITGGIAQSAAARPLAADGTRYGRYSHALRDLARPKLLDNRVSYRLLDVEWTGAGGRLGFGYTSYFENLDVCEAAAQEFAAAWLRATKAAQPRGSRAPPTRRRPVRSRGSSRAAQHQHPDRPPRPHRRPPHIPPSARCQSRSCCGGHAPRRTGRHLPAGRSRACPSGQ